MSKKYYVNIVRLSTIAAKSNLIFQDNIRHSAGSVLMKHLQAYYHFQHKLLPLTSTLTFLRRRVSLRIHHISQPFTASCGAQE